MSHASLLVAMDDCSEDEVEERLEWNMRPFDESGAMFRKGSRWDWYVIGGRWSGLVVPTNVVQVSNLKFDPPHTFPPHYAFLQNRRWNEGKRMGWFGGTIKSECEPATKTKHRRCLVKDAKSKSAIVVWNEDHQNWGHEFYARFVEPLPTETWLVTVDYHV